MKKGVKKNNFKKSMNKFWDVVWRDDSPKGWIISIVFLFVLIKLILLPTISLVTGTALPLVIVESCSMHHENTLFSDYDDWFSRQDLKYFEYKINKKMFDEFPFKKGFTKGDILLLTGVKASKIEVGDVIVFNANYKHPIIHRVISIQEENEIYSFTTLGDNNPESYYFETNIPESQVIGKAQANIAPFLGWIKLIFFEPSQPENNKGFCQENQ